MPAQLRPNRQDVTDRFPILGFTLRTDTPPRFAEVVLATDPALFTRRDGRSPSTFYSSREHGPLSVPRGEAVYVVPPEVLARFVAADRLWFALATASSATANDWTVEQLPTASSPYVSLSGLSDRALRRVRMFPARGGYGARSGGAVLDWAGDRAQPGMTPAAAPSAPTRSPAAPAPVQGHVPYDDGFGPLPPLQSAAPATDAPAPNPPPASPSPVPAAQSWSRGLDVDPEEMGIDSAPYTEGEAVQEFRAAALALTSADYDRVARTVPSPAFTAGRSGQTIDRIVIHITDAPTTSSTVNHFSAAGAQASAHYLVGQDGEIVQFVSEADTAWHARGVNSRSIGIEHVAVKQGGVTYPRPNGGSQTFPFMPPTDIQYAESAALVAHLCDKYRLTPNRTTIIGHREADPRTTHGSCPDGAWNWDHFMNLVTNRISAAQSLGVSRALSGDGDTVEIKYRAFIPSPAIKGPPLLPNYHGDGRSFSYSGGTSRGEITFTVDMAPSGALSNLRITDRHWSPTHSYDSADTPAVEGKPDWWLGLNAGAVATDTGHCPLSDDTLRASFGAPGSTRAIQATIERAQLVSLYMSGNNPLVPGSPAIDADITVMLRRSASGGIEAKAVGSHDGFPAHELYVNRQRLIAYDPVTAGNGPSALLPPADQDVDTRWTNVSSGSASAQSLGDEIALDPGIGGMSIGPDALEVGDLIVATTNHPISGLIRAGSGAPVSHVMLYVGQGEQVIEAVGDGVLLRPLSQAIEHAVLAVAFRVRGLDATQRQQVADAACRYVGRGFGFLGLVRAGLYKIDSALCDLLPNGAGERCRAFAGRIDLGQGSTNRMFCSQLVIQSFLDAGKPLTSEVPHGVAPGDIVNLDMRDNVLDYVGHLKAQPPTFFGISLGMIDAVRGASQALTAGDDYSINWDDVQRIAQPTRNSCWATAAAMLIGWRDRVSVTPTSVAACDGLTLSDGLSPSDKASFAAAAGLTAAPNASYTPDGFRDLLESYGPIWVTAKVPGVHAIVVTGMYRAGGRDYVRITDPWDRIIGEPGAPGAYAASPSTGSQYIMTYAAFAAEFEAAGDINRIQLLHTGGTHGHTINRGNASAAGYALSSGDTPSSAPGDASLGVGTALTRQTSEKNGRRYDLAQLAGMVRPANALAGGAGSSALPGERVMLDDWPYIEGPSGRTQAGVSIDWKFGSGAVGDIVIAPVGGQVLDGWSAAVRADISPDASAPERTQLTVRVTTTFSRAGEEDQVAVTDVVLMGDGRQQTRHGADRAPDPVRSVLEHA